MLVFQIIPFKMQSVQLFPISCVLDLDSFIWWFIVDNENNFSLLKGMNDNCLMPKSLNSINS